MTAYGPRQEEAALRYLLRRAARMTWERDALCKEIGQRLFYPEEIDPGGPGIPRRVESPEGALTACALCPVMAECRAVALARREKYGVWGGMTENGRKEARKSKEATRQSLLDALNGVVPQSRNGHGVEAPGEPARQLEAA